MLTPPLAVEAVELMHAHFAQIPFEVQTPDDHYQCVAPSPDQPLPLPRLMLVSPSQHPLPPVAVLVHDLPRLLDSLSSSSFDRPLPLLALSPSA